MNAKLFPSWSVIFKCIIARWLCFEVYEQMLKTIQVWENKARRVLLAIFLFASLFFPSYLSMSRYACAGFDAAVAQYTWLTWDVYAIAHEQARVNEVPPQLILAVIDAESRGCSRAVSCSGALGLMQVVPRWHYSGDPRDLFNPRVNIMVASRYLKWCRSLAGGCLIKTMRNYERGPGGSGINVPYTARIMRNVMGTI